MGGSRAAAMATPMMALIPPPVKAKDTATPDGAATKNPENKHHAVATMRSGEGESVSGRHVKPQSEREGGS